MVLSRCSWTLYNFRRNLLREIGRLRGRVVCVGGGGDGFDRRLQMEGFDFRPTSISRRGVAPLKDLLLFAQLWALFRKQRPEIIHCFTVKPAIYGTLAAAAAGVPVRIVTITGLGHAFTTGQRWLRYITRQLYRFALSRADLVFFQNEEDRDLFIGERLVSRKRTALVPGSGVDLDAFRPSSLPIESGAHPTFLMIARLLREKGICEYVSAARKVKERNPNVRFLLIGGLDTRNPSALTKEAFERLNSDHAVTWMGEVDDVRPYIEVSDVIVLPSYREGTPRSLLEAAAMGRPVVTTDAVGCREAVRPGITGYSVPVADGDALVEALLKSIGNPAKTADMGRAGRTYMEEHFDERKVIEMTLASYDRLLNEKAANA